MKLDEYELNYNAMLLEMSWNRLRKFKELKAPLFIIKAEQCILWKRRYCKKYDKYPDIEIYERLKAKYRQIYTMQ